MASFDENGKYIKTNWKAGDKITATKLNKIEESIEAVNDNDISRHVEADARLDALEAKDVAHDKELTNIKNTIADNKAAAELGDYDINSRMTFLENELNEGIEEVYNVAETVDGKINAAVTNVNNVASTVDGKIAAAEANMTTQVNQGKADMEAMVAEVEGELDDINEGLSRSLKYQTIEPDSYSHGIHVNTPNVYDRDYMHKTIEVDGYAMLINSNTYDSERIRISDNKIISKTADAIELNNPLNEESSGNKTCENVIVTNNFIAAEGIDDNHSAGFALGIAGTKNVAVVGNVSTYSRQEGLHIEDTQENVTVVGNIFDGNYHDGVWVMNAKRSEQQYARTPIINSNHIMQYENKRTGIGLYTVHSGDFGVLHYANMRNNRVEGFNVGVDPDGGSQADIDGCVFENCRVAINAKGNVYGNVTVKGDTETLVHFSNRARMNGIVKSSNNQYDPDKIFTFTDACKFASLNGFSCRLADIPFESPTTNKYTSVNICKAPSYMNGVVTIGVASGATSIYSYRCFEFEMGSDGNSTMQNLHVDQSGVLSFNNLGIRDGYLYLSMFHATDQTYRITFTFEGIICWSDDNIIGNMISTSSLDSSSVLQLSNRDYKLKISNPSGGMIIRVPNVTQGTYREIKVFIDNPGTVNMNYYLRDHAGNTITNLYKHEGFIGTVNAGCKHILTLTYMYDFWMVDSVNLSLS